MEATLRRWVLSFLITAVNKRCRNILFPFVSILFPTAAPHKDIQIQLALEPQSRWPTSTSAPGGQKNLMGKDACIKDDKDEESRNRFSP